MISSYAKDGLISVQSLREITDPFYADKNLRVQLVDASYSLAGTAELYAGYREGRIAQAVFFDIDKIADHKTSLPHMLPLPEEFSKAASDLGLRNDSLIVVYGQGPAHMGPARAWWMFRAFGHENVAVLDGGLPAWEAARYPVNRDPPPGRHRTGDFRAKLNPELVRDMAQMRRTSADQSAFIFDARPVARFQGTQDEPRPNLARGHIPGSACVPATELYNADGCMKPAEELGVIFEKAGFDPDRKKPVYATCGSGVTACNIALGLYRIGYRHVAVYDGSWAEWGDPASGLPVAAL